MSATFISQFLFSPFMVTQNALNPLYNGISTLGDRALASEAGRSGLQSFFHLSLAQWPWITSFEP